MSSSHSSSMRTFRSSDSASEIGSSETSFSEPSQPYFALCSPRSKSSANVSGGAAAEAAGRPRPSGVVGGRSGAPQQQQTPRHHQPCRRSSSAKTIDKPARSAAAVRRDLSHVNSFPDSHKTPPGAGPSSTYYTPPRSPSLSVTTPTDGVPPRHSPVTPSSTNTAFKFPPSASCGNAFSGGCPSTAVVHHYGRTGSSGGGTNPNTPRTLPRSPSTGSANTTSYNTNSDSACNTHRSVLHDA